MTVLQTARLAQWLFALGFSLAIAACAPSDLKTACEGGGALEGSCRVDASDLKVNDLQAVGSHNSYKRAIPAPELAMIAATNAVAAAALDYAHIPLGEQLSLGMRQLEIDVYHDPEGGLFIDPLLPRATASAPGAQAFDPTGLDAPGFKVLHTHDIDPRSWCPTLVACLKEVRDWSDANTEHVPLLILINLKQGEIPVPGSVTPVSFDAAAFDALDAELRSVFDAKRIIEPDDVRGDAETLREAALAGGWPELDASRGKVLFALDTGAESVRLYLRDRPSLEGLPMFVSSLSEDAPHAAYFTMNNPLRDGDLIAERVRSGFLIRTRADADTKEARTNDTRRREAAFASGAQYISTDYYEPRTDFSSYQVSLPGGAPARCNPVKRDEACAPR